MAPMRHSIPDAADTSFRGIQSNKHQVDLISTGLGFAQQVQLTVTGESGFDGKTDSLVEIFGGAFQSFPAGGESCRCGIETIQGDGNRIGIEQPVAALEICQSSDCRFSGAVRTSNYCEGGHAALGGVSRYFADNFVVFSGWEARQPTNLELAAIGEQHCVEAILVEVENGTPGRKRLQEGLVAGRISGIVKLFATEFVSDRHA